MKAHPETLEKLNFSSKPGLTDRKQVAYQPHWLTSNLELWGPPVFQGRHCPARRVNRSCFDLVRCIDYLSVTWTVTQPTSELFAGSVSTAMKPGGVYV